MDAADHPATASLSGEKDEPLYSKATRWRTYLSAHSTAFRSLQEERERGWRSAALDAWYARRQAPAAAPQGSSTKAPAAPPAPSAPPPPAAGATSFVAADVVQLAERYRQHARNVTQHAAGTFFTRGSSASSNSDGGDTGKSSPLFLDLGCAPGGVSKYLLEDLHWRGVGVSLASTDGGIEVDPSLLVAAPLRHNFVLLDGDVTEKAALWCRSSAYAQLTRPSDASSNTEAPTVLNGLMRGGTELPKGAFHFVNGGAVLDHGQRQRGAQSAEEVVQDCHADASLPSSAPPSSSSTSNAPLLPWFSLLVPQLTHALTYAAEGGAIMLVHGAPHCASFFILLRCMEDVVAAGQSCGTKEGGRRHCAARVLETMHLAKPPVYVLWTNLWPGTDSNNSDNGKASGAGELRAASQAAQQRLLASLSPASPLISPSTAAAAVADEPLTGAVDHSTRAAKQRFWLGESEDGFQLAVEGFARYGDQVERIWRRVEEFLRRRRERAEREATATTTLTRANDSRKRPHSAT